MYVYNQHRGHNDLVWYTTSRLSHPNMPTHKPKIITLGEKVQEKSSGNLCSTNILCLSKVNIEVTVTLLWYRTLRFPTNPESLPQMIKYRRNPLKIFWAPSLYINIEVMITVTYSGTGSYSTQHSNFHMPSHKPKIITLSVAA